DLAFGKFRELADRLETPALERFRNLERRRELAERKRRQKRGFPSGRDDSRRFRKARRNARRELGGGDAGARREAGLFRREKQIAAETERGRPRRIENRELRIWNEGLGFALV